MNRKTINDYAELLRLSTEQLEREAERLQLEDEIDGAKLAEIDKELRRRRAAR